MNHPDAYFDALMAKVVDEVATEDEFATFEEILLHDAELRQQYLQCMRVHALLCCRSEGQAAGARMFSHSTPVRRDGDMRAAAKSRPRPLNMQDHAASGGSARHGQHSPAGWKAAAAAAAAILLGAGIWMARVQRPSSVVVSAVPSSVPVALIRKTNAMGLELPVTLPGAVRL
ncbi:MAG: hypothetical protein WCU90_06890, partial [Kiritimatiellia bacterium]